jgi:hypothetical protein
VFLGEGSRLFYEEEGSRLFGEEASHPSFLGVVQVGEDP